MRRCPFCSANFRDSDAVAVQSIVLPWPLLFGLMVPLAKMNFDFKLHFFVIKELIEVASAWPKIPNGVLASLLRYIVQKASVVLLIYSVV